MLSCGFSFSPPLIVPRGYADLKHTTKHLPKKVSFSWGVDEKAREFQTAQIYSQQRRIRRSVFRDSFEIDATRGVEMCHLL